MFGAALGDIVGSIYEFSPIKRKDFVFLTEDMDFTDDTIMTVAVQEALMHSDLTDEEETKLNLIKSMKKWGRLYPNPTGAYGSMFSHWLTSPSPHPYGSWGEWICHEGKCCRLVVQYNGGNKKGCTFICCGDPQPS